MRFHAIPIAAGEADGVNPRTSPAVVPDNHIHEVPLNSQGTSERPTKMALTLEGTDTQTTSVQLWVLEEKVYGDNNSLKDDPTSGLSARKFYKLGSAVTVTVGAVSVVDIVPGKIYLQTSTNPEAASTLKCAVY